MAKELIVTILEKEILLYLFHHKTYGVLINLTELENHFSYVDSIQILKALANLQNQKHIDMLRNYDITIEKFGIEYIEDHFIEDLNFSKKLPIGNLINNTPKNKQSVFKEATMWLVSTQNIKTIILEVIVGIILIVISRC